MKASWNFFFDVMIMFVVEGTPYHRTAQNQSASWHLVINTQKYKNVLFSGTCYFIQKSFAHFMIKPFSLWEQIIYYAIMTAINPCWISADQVLLQLLFRCLCSKKRLILKV